MPFHQFWPQSLFLWSDKGCWSPTQKLKLSMAHGAFLNQLMTYHSCFTPKIAVERKGTWLKKIKAYRHGVHSMLFGTLSKSFNFCELQFPHLQGGIVTSTQDTIQGYCENQMSDWESTSLYREGTIAALWSERGSAQVCQSHWQHFYIKAPWKTWSNWMIQWASQMHYRSLLGNTKWCLRVQLAPKVTLQAGE